MAVQGERPAAEAVGAARRACASLDAGHRVTHLDLLSIARDVRRAAAGDDTGRLHDELTRLRDELMRHLAGEQAEMDAIPGSRGRIVRDGQRRLLRLVGDVLVGGGADGNCLVRVVGIELALHRQARLETTVRRGAPRAGARRAIPPGARHR